MSHPEIDVWIIRADLELRAYDDELVENERRRAVQMAARRPQPTPQVVNTLVSHFPLDETPKLRCQQCELVDGKCVYCRLAEKPEPEPVVREPGWLGQIRARWGFL